LNDELSSGYRDLFEQLDDLATGGEVGATLRAANPGSSFASVYTVDMKRVQAVVASLEDHLDGAMNASSADERGGWTAWSSGYSYNAKMDGSLGAGYGGTNTSDSGALMGVEKRFGRGRLGIFGATGQGRSTFSDPQVRLDSNHWHGGLYGSVSLGKVVVDGTAAFGVSDMDSVRTFVNGRRLGEVYRGDFESRDTQLSIGVSMNLADESSDWRITPIARLKYVSISQDSFDETGTGSTAFSVNRNSESTWLSKLGMRVSHSRKLAERVALAIDGAAFWIHDFDAGARDVALGFAGGDTRFISSGRASDADILQLSLGAQAVINDRWTLRLSGAKELGSTRSQKTGLVSVGLNF
jgi:outer membrane autotransporter protein